MNLLAFLTVILTALSVMGLPSATGDARLPKRPDIVIIDTGSMQSFKGTLNMEKNCVKCWHEHGTAMAMTLESQLLSLGAKPVQATQIVYYTIADLPAKIRQAVALKPRVISMSIAGEEPSEVEMNAVKLATDAGILVVAAAGNQGFVHTEYPAGYDLPCLVSVSTRVGPKIAVWNNPASPGDIYLPYVRGEFGTSFSTQRAAAFALYYFQKNSRGTCKSAEEWLTLKFGSVQPALK
jgi:hypothetical protein